MRARTAWVLAGLAVPSLAAGWWWGVRDPAAVAVLPVGLLAFPGLAARLQGAARVEIERGAHVLAIVHANGVWGVAEKGGYPVLVDRLRALLTGLVELRLVEPRTSDPRFYQRLGVGDPRNPDGTAMGVRVLDAGGQVLANLIVGTVRSEATGGGEVFVRKPDAAQSWLAAGQLTVSADPETWLDRRVLDVAKGHVLDVLVQRAGAVVELAREAGKPVLRQPAEHAAVDAFRAEETLGALAGLQFTDVERGPAPGDVVATSRYTLAGGEAVMVTVHQTGWVTIAASGAEAARVGGWAYRFAGWKTRALAPGLADLVGAP